jgi:HK97 gp10 family phage protein
MGNQVTINPKAIEDLKKELVNKLELIGEVVRSEVVNNIDEMEIIDTGRYKNSIDYDVDKEELVVRIGTNVEYAPFLEFGTIKMAPRPALRLGFYESEKKINEILEK